MEVNGYWVSLIVAFLDKMFVTPLHNIVTIYVLQYYLDINVMFLFKPVNKITI